MKCCGYWRCTNGWCLPARRPYQHRHQTPWSFIRRRLPTIGDKSELNPFIDSLHRSSMPFSISLLSHWQPFLFHRKFDVKAAITHLQQTWRICRKWAVCTDPGKVPAASLHCYTLISTFESGAVLGCGWTFWPYRGRSTCTIIPAVNPSCWFWLLAVHPLLLRCASNRAPSICNRTMQSSTIILQGGRTCL